MLWQPRWTSDQQGGLLATSNSCGLQQVLQEEMMPGRWGQATFMGWLCGLAVVAAMGTLLTAPRQHCGFAGGPVSCQRCRVLTQLLPW